MEINIKMAHPSPLNIEVSFIIRVDAYTHGRSQDFFRGETLFQKNFQKILKKFFEKYSKNFQNNIQQIFKIF